MNFAKASLSIEIWSDYLCPWCFIGDENLKQALNELQVDNEVTHKSFQSNPGQNQAETIYEIASRNGMNIKSAKQRARQIEEMGNDVGLAICMDNVVMVNTLDAHRLAYYARQQGIGKQMTRRLLESSFIDGKDISDFTQLANIAVELGLDHSEVLNVLKSGKYEKEVRKDIEDAIQLKIQGVPFYLINNKYVLTGAMLKEDFKNEITKVLEQEAPVQMGSGQRTICGENGCIISNEKKN